MKMRNGFALGVMALCFGTAPAMAQSNFSNASGVNNSQPSGVPSFGTPGCTVGNNGSNPNDNRCAMTGYSSTVLEQARSLQQQLADAQSQRSVGGIRIFSRTAQAPAPNEKLVKAKADASAFLESVKNPGPNLLAAPTAPVAKINPTW